MTRDMNPVAPLKLAALLFLRVTLTLSGRAEAQFADGLAIGGEDLTLVGSGTRKKAFIGVYDAALYLSGSPTSSEQIIDADMAMAVSIVTTSRLISAKRLSSAMRDGFERSTGGQTAPLETEIAQFQEAFADPVGKGDRFDLLYSPGTGVRVFRNSQPSVVVQGIDFKRALFGIWLGPDPVQESLKKALMAQ